MLLFLLTVCAAPEATDSGAEPVHLPGHNDCLPEGETMTDEVCLAVVADQGRYPTVSENKLGVEVLPEEPRQFEPERVWLSEQAKRCTCACCHTRKWGGAGVYFWDLDWTPVWTDSASLWSLSVFAGRTDEYVQTLPIEELERVEAFYEAETAARDALHAEE